MQYYILPTDKDIQHYGVLGMKWGIRRYQPYSTVPRKSGKGGKETGEASRSAKRYAKKNIKYAYKDAKRVYNIVSDSRLKEAKQIVDKSHSKEQGELVTKLETLGESRSNTKEYKDLYKKFQEVRNRDLKQYEESAKNYGNKSELTENWLKYEEGSYQLYRAAHKLNRSKIVLGSEEFNKAFNKVAKNKDLMDMLSLELGDIEKHQKLVNQMYKDRIIKKQNNDFNRR